MALWRRTSLPPSARTASDRSARDDDQLRRHIGDIDDRGAGTGEAHNGANAEGCADCGASGTAGSTGVKAKSVYPTNSREKLRQQQGRFEKIKLTGENRCHRTFVSAVGSVHPAPIGAIAAVFAQSVHQALCRMGFDTLPLKTTVLRPDKKFLKKILEF